MSDVSRAASDVMRSRMSVEVSDVHAHLDRGRRLLTLPPGHAPTRLGFRLTTPNVAVSIPPRVAGSYILMTEGAVTYVGRSDRCLRTRLSAHPLRGRATHFCATVADTPRQAYLFESYWWHRYTRDGARLINRIHPAAPDTSIACPFCGYAGNDTTRPDSDAGITGTELISTDALAAVTNPQTAAAVGTR